MIRRFGMGLGICLLLALGLLRAGAAQAAQRGLEDGLPAAFDWRNAGKVTPVRDAGACAASQAFSATAMLESAVAIETGKLVDLSEQYLLSCGGGTVTCMDGDWDVHDYHTGLFNPPQQAGGAVLESAMRYRAAVTPCTRVAAHPYQILRWGYVNPAGASVEEIQQAIYQHGPVGVSVCVGNAFRSYHGGVFAMDERLFCSGLGMTTNHSVVLVGWDNRDQTWILKNSWGKNWGEDGYMRIRYGVSNIGQDANYIVYAAPPGIVQLTAPPAAALVTDGRPQLGWLPPVTGQADRYELQVAEDAAFTRLLHSLETAQTRWQPDAAERLPGDRLLYWRVRAVRAVEGVNLPGPWSSARTLRTLPEIPRSLTARGTGLRPWLGWVSPSRTERFELQLDSGRIYRGSGYDYTPTTDLPRQPILLWRVRVRGKYGFSDWSAWSALHTAQ